MKRLTLAAAAAVLLASSALAQPSPLTPADQFVGSLQITVSDALSQIKIALVQQDRQIAELRQQVAALTKEKTDLSAAKDDLTKKAAELEQTNVALMAAAKDRAAQKPACGTDPNCTGVGADKPKP